MRSWRYYRGAVEQVREPNVSAGPLDLENGDRFVHYLREGGVDYFGVYATDHKTWLAAQPPAVGVVEVAATDVPNPNWHTHRCAERAAGWEEIGLAPTAHYRTVPAGAVADAVRDDREMVLAVDIGEAGDGPLPPDTPYLELLLDAGVETVAEARAMDLTGITGIGDARAAQILASLPEPVRVLHVAGPDRPGLPGDNAGTDLAALPGVQVQPHTFG